MRFYECGCCGCYHLEEFDGDCRDDLNRYTLDQIDPYLDEIIELEL
jgi:hypothetical protein